MDQQRLDAIRARCEAATEGPWELTKDGRYEDHDECRINLPNDTIELCSYENGEFIAHARTDVPDLLAEVERLNKVVYLLESDRDAERKLRLDAEAERAETIDAAVSEARHLRLTIFKLDKHIRKAWRQRDTWRRRAEAAEKDLANAALCENCIHADNDECSVTCGDSDSAYRWEWRGPGEDEPNDTKEANHADE